MLSRTRLSAVLGGAAVTLALALLLSGMAPAQTTDSSDSNVTLSVTETVSVSISPALFNFSNTQLGATNFSTTPAHGLFLTIDNDGSTNITDIYAHPDTLLSEQDNPLGTGNPAEYAAGRFLWIKNASSQMYHASAMTWNITADAGGEPSGVTGKPSNAQSEGFYRNTTGDYLWSMGAAANGFCNETSATLRMKNVVDDGSNRDLSASSTDYVPDVTGNTWGVDTDGSGGPIAAGPLAGHYVALHESCTKAVAFRFDDDGQFGLGNNAAQFLVGPADTAGGELTPGETHQARVGAALHFGVPQGQTNRTLLTIHVSKG